MSHAIESRARHNSYDLLRLVAATVVVLAHSFTISGFPIPSIVSSTDPGTIAVYVFFALSGFLVAKSWELDPDLRRFALKRLFRIYPALIALYLITALVIGPLMTSVTLAEYFSSIEVLKILRRAILPDGGGELPGVFEGHAHRWVNAPPWTIKYELLMYAILAILGVLNFLRHRWFAVPAAIICAALWFAISASYWQPPKLPGGYMAVDHIVSFGAFFFAGVSLHYTAIWRSIPCWAVFLALVATAALWTTSFRIPALVLSLPLAVVVLGSKDCALGRVVRRMGDWSYGVYIYGWLTAQILTALGKGWSWPAMAFTQTIVALACGALSWHLIEKRALKLKPAKNGQTETPPSNIDTSDLPSLANARQRI